MKINFVKDFKYTDYSNNLFTKILLVNALTKKEISELNEKYKELGLFIKQVEVDEYGKELYPDELLSQNNFLKKKRRLKKHSRMTLQEFYDKYYSKNKKSEKNKKKKNNVSGGNNKNNDNDESSDSNKNDYCNKNELKELLNNLDDVYKNCQIIEIKKSKIEDKGLKKVIIEYIKKYTKFLSESQYNKLFNEWKKKNWNIKGFNINDTENLWEWKIPILKGFKSEISFFGCYNIIKVQIGESINSDLKDNDNDKDNNNERDEEEEDESDNDDYSEENNLNNNYFYAKIYSQKYIKNDDDEID